MTLQTILSEPSRVDEPQAVKDFSDVLSRVASELRPVIVRRNGEDLAAVIPLEHLELFREVLARQEAEQIAAQIAWERLVPLRRPPQRWFDEGENPFEPEGAAP